MTIAIVLIVALGISGAVSTIAGVYLLTGLAGGLLAGGAFLFGAAAVLRKGLIKNV